MSDSLDYLNIEQNDQTVLKNLSKMGDFLKQLHVKMLEAEENFKQAKNEYEHYANVTIPTAMLSAGIDSISLASGGRLSVLHKFYCQPNKNPADRAKIAEWLRNNGGGHIVEHNATVSAEDVEKLESQGIPFIENTSVNTQKLKSFIKEGIGQGTGAAKFSIEDVPECIHFQEVTTVELEV